MSAMRGYTCDGPGCSASAVTKDHHARPEGWVLVFGDSDGRGSWHFCGWDCLALAVDGHVGDASPAALTRGGAS